MKPWEDERKRLEKEKNQLLVAKEALESEDGAIISANNVWRQLDSDDRNKLAKRILQLNSRRTELNRELVNYNDNAAAYFRARRKHEAGLSVAEKHVGAQKQALQRKFRELTRYLKHQMGYSFKFKASETDALSGNASYRLPTYLGTLSLGFGGTGSQKREGERRVSLVTTLDDLGTVKCTDAPAEASVLQATYYPITGTIGVEEVIEQYFVLLDRAREDAEAANGRPDDDDEEKQKEKERKSFDKTDAYVDTIVFTTTLTGSLTPSIVLNPTQRAANCVLGGK